MITRKAVWDSLTDNQRFALLTKAELQRDNAVEYIRELNGTSAEARQLAERNRLIETGRLVAEGRAA